MSVPTTNLLPLERWRTILQFHPWHFWGMSDSTLLSAAGEGCSSLTRQYAWQNSDAASRTEIGRAIQAAESILAEHLGYWVAPAYLEETHDWPGGLGWRWPTIQLDTGMIQAAGVEQLDSISAAAPVTMSDVDSDGYDDTFTIGPIVTSVTDPAQIALYFAAADRFALGDRSSDVGPSWRIEPVSVTISAGLVTIKGPAWLLVDPVLYEGVTNVGANGLNPATPGTYVTTLDVYRRWTNPDGTDAASSSQGAVIWETRPCHGWWCACGCTTSASFDPAATATATARIGLRNAENGIVSIGEASYNASSATWSTLETAICDVPDRAVVRFLAGIPLDRDGQMQRIAQIAVARLAAAELARPICGCEDANRELARWQFDLARSSGANDEIYGAISASDLDNPLGTRRGHIFAWRFIRQRQRLVGMLA